MAPQIWLVTGTTSGIGKMVIQELVRRGDKVIATGRKVEERLGAYKSDSLRLLELDISADRVALAAKVQEAWAIFGHIDVVLNNAGMNQLMSAEEASYESTSLPRNPPITTTKANSPLLTSEDHIHALLTTNLLGAVRLTQAVLPLMRAQRSGTLAFISSSSAWNSLPFMSLYAASKAGLSAFVESLHKEIRPLGLRAVAIECGGFPTSLSQARDGAPPPPPPTQIADYVPGLTALGGMFASDPAAYMPGDLARVAPRIVDVVKREGPAAGRPWAVRVVLGSDAHAAIAQKVREVAGLLEGWKDVSYSTDSDAHKGGATEVYLEAVSILEKE
jgi:NAD(P)-dependent dehydrogenase (short-subunit alcohol dehydrogenase family)